MEYAVHFSGIQGSRINVSPCLLNPRMLSRPALYIHPAAPVYQDQPPLPTWGGSEYTSAAMTYGSTLYIHASLKVRAWLMGFSIRKLSHALLPAPILAKAMTAHAAAWVYCPPFSRTPGGYPLI